MLIDSHCHLNQLKLPQDKTLSAILADAQDRGVHGFLSVATDLKSCSEVQKQSLKYPNVWCSAGIHPLHQIESEDWQRSLTKYLSETKCIAVGETGLDYYYQKEKGQHNIQKQCFLSHVQLSQEHHKPLIIHTRDAKKDTLALLNDQSFSDHPGVIHCFTEDLTFAKNILDLGFYISFTGIVTFKNAQSLREVVKYVPIEKLLVETDSPYLTPEPYRRTPNLPQYVIEVAQCIAKLKGVSLSELAHKTTSNFEHLFKIKTKKTQTFSLG